jgi:hypothetical protein
MGGRPFALTGPRPSLRTYQRPLLVHHFDFGDVLRGEEDPAADPNVWDLAGVAEAAQGVATHAQFRRYIRHGE